MPFTPKQALTPTPELFSQLTADAMPNMARTSLATLDIPAGSIVHDNGCGSGAGSQAFREKQADISIKATDIDEAALKMYPGPGEASRMDSTALTFPDNTFTHSLMNAVIFTLPDDGIDGVKEVHRTLRPGGTAIINCIQYGPNIIPLQNTSRRTRPEGTPGPRHGSEKWHDPNFLQGIVEKGGFSNVKITEGRYKSVTRTDLHSFATMLWSFVGGTTPNGWIESDVDRWDEAIEILQEELSAAEGFTVFDDRIELEFKVNIAIATK